MPASTSATGSSRLSTSVVARYAIGSLGTGGFATLPGLVLVFYMTDTLGVAAWAAGLVVTVAKIWDVLIDPLIGGLSDRSLLHSGSRRRLMIVGGIALPIFFLLTFAVPAGVAPAAAGAWVVIAFILASTSFSLFQVPYIALPAELSDHYDQRTRLLTTRVAVLSGAILLFGAGGPILRKIGDPYTGYLVMALVAGLVIGAGMLIASTVAPKGMPYPDAHGIPFSEGYREGIAALRRSAPFRALLGTFLLQALATGLMLAAANYVAVWVMHSDDALTFLFVALIGPAILFSPVWNAISRRIGKERAYVWATVIFTIAAATLTIAIWAPGAWMYASVAAAGAAYAGMQALPMAMLPDVISHDARLHGEARAGVFGGVWTAGETTGMALGAAALAAVLSITGYVQTVAGHVVVQPGSAVVGIAVGFSVVPAALAALSLLTLSRYRLRREDIDGPGIPQEALA
ncbi:MFS transporter [Microbacterium sp. ASV49]|uniref:MFS transporter n=1 Tax=Microbacterium candidum TaxID=3041922 RepID=A0ABT7MY82_9MICO|nr:MFS transporter [Microbacterium sp. ASV49]MDL9979403.1 MFS transporter [Microbacterium sp. ASV49]